MSIDGVDNVFGTDVISVNELFTCGFDVIVSML